MAIEMFCDRCETLIDHTVNGGVRLKMGKREYVFHLCGACQQLLREEVQAFLKAGEWKEA